jgi:hypothetical protein
MKKLTLSLIMIVAVLFITACVQPVSEVDTFTLSGWTMKDYYDIGDEDALWADGVTLNVVYRDGTSESLDLDSSVNDGTVTLTGDYNDDPLGLETGARGYYSVTITIDNVSLSFSYYVFDLSLARFVGVSETYETITEALTGATDGTTIFVEDGIYEESVSISGKENITIFGESEEYVIIDSSGSSDRALFATGADNLSLINLTFQDNYTNTGSGGSKQYMVKLQTGTHNATLRNVTVVGPGKNALLSNGSNPIGGLDLNTIDGALIENVTVKDVSRNAMAFASVSNLTLRDIHIENVNEDQSGWSAIALYRSNPKNLGATTSLVEITGSIIKANIAFNYDVPPYAGFEFGSLSIENVNIYLKGSVTDPVGDPNDDNILDRLESTDAFAMNVIEPSASWRVPFQSEVDFNETNDPEDVPDIKIVLDYYYFLTEDDANSFIDFLELVTELDLSSIEPENIE